MSFWIIAALMTAVALAVALLPLLRTPSRSGERETENLAIYRQRLRELDREVAEGQLPADEADGVRAELERRLLEDVEPDEARARPTTPAGRPARRVVFWSIFVALPLGAVALYAALGMPPREIQARPGMAGGDLPQLVERLRQRLKERPGNGAGWALLGRSYLTLERPDLAVPAFDRARSLLGDQPDLLVDYARALALRNGGDFQGRPSALLDEALENAPDDPAALWLSGMAAAQRGDAGQARRYWQRLLAQLEPGGDAAAAVKEQLAELGPGKGGATAAVAMRAVESGESAPVVSHGIQVTVELAPDLASRARPDDTVFVYARAVDGPPMPLAAVRRKVSDLPLTIRLDDDSAMMPGRKLSSADRVVVGARVSSSGSARVQEGDLEGTSGTFNPERTGAVRIVIDAVVQ